MISNYNSRKHSTILTVLYNLLANSWPYPHIFCFPGGNKEYFLYLHVCKYMQLYLEYLHNWKLPPIGSFASKLCLRRRFVGQQQIGAIWSPIPTIFQQNCHHFSKITFCFINQPKPEVFT